jgi:dTDP-4-amino-4,6-dideoxygalactose transaminase
MQRVLPPRRTAIVLPSDQDASGRRLGVEEIALLKQVIESGTLTSTKGNFVKTLEREFAQILGSRHAFACSSGSSAMHAAVVAIDPEPGDEIITTPITDMGALAPILYQSAIPVFADVEPLTCNVTASTIEKCLSDRTKAIVVTHLFGNPCEMPEILELANRRGIPVIEDCAQSFLATSDGRPVGTLGAIGCFSLQQGKHITTGEGGLVVTDNDAYARRMNLFINKGWPYGEPNPDHEFLALNSRMCELQGAVGVAQLEKLGDSVRNRAEAAEQLTAMIQDLPGITTPYVAPGCVHVFWKYCLRVDSRVILGGAPALASKLRECQIASAPRYIQKPAFMCKIFRDQRTFGDSRFPFNLARPEAVDYSPSRFPGAFEALEGILVLPWNERYTTAHVESLADSIRDAVSQLSEGFDRE